MLHLLVLLPAQYCVDRHSGTLTNGSDANRMMEDVTELKLEWRMMTSPAPGAEQGSALMALSSTQWTQRPASGGENLANSLSCPYTAVFRLYRYHNPNVHTGGLNVHKTWLT